MKVIRHSLFKKTGSVFLLLVFLQSIFLPTYSWALTTGPHQPEYISYEGSGSPDMVNLSTGDFTFSLPILEVPGPEGGFSLPLSYHAGIGLDQEASWVGLGWTLNPGGITRSINEYPDDANGESQSISVKDLNVIRGWTSSILGFGQIGWNNQTGHNGSISLLGLLDYNYSDSGPNSLGIVGVNISSAGVKVDPIGVAMAALTIVSMGAGSAVAVTAKAVLTDVAFRMATSAVMSAVFSSQTPGVGSNGFWSYSEQVKQRLFHKNYWIWLDKTRTEQMFGTLNLGASNVQPYQALANATNLSLKINNAEAPLNQFAKSTSGSSNAYQVGVASDMSYFIDPLNEYYAQSNPSGLATDNYSVSGPGISGSIKPYRLEIGSLSMPREMSASHQRLAPISYLNSYKVPFVYEGSNSSNYFHHLGGAINTAPVAALFNQGITTTLGSAAPTTNTSLTYNLNDYIFGSSNRVSSEVSATSKIPQQNHVEWFTNDQIKANTAAGFMDFTGDATIRNSFRSNFGFGAMYFYSTDDDFSDGKFTLSTTEAQLFQNGNAVTLKITHTFEDGNPQGNESLPYSCTVISSNSGTGEVQLNISTVPMVDRSKTAPNYLSIEITLNKTTKPTQSIGGYSITNGNGMTYHYALPTYDHELKTEIIDKAATSKSTTIKRSAPFANTWLLTAITGPDFYDYNNNGFPDENDWGYWVRLNYGKYNPSTMFYWRSPYEGKRADAENKTDAHSEGKKELYYLNSIQTRTHTALFFKDVRQDGRGYSNQGQQLLLKEIYLIRNEDYNQLVLSTGYNLGTCIGTTGKVRLLSELTPAPLAFLNSRCLKKIQLDFSYNLCQNTSPGYSTAATKGKLTLERVSVRGRNNQKIVPDYVFSYGSNPYYNKDYWDAWGFYNGTNSRIPQGNYADAWSLTKVTTPLGHEIEVSYERDEYSTVWGNQAQEIGSFFDNDWTDGIILENASYYSVGDLVTVNGSKSWECIGTPGGQFDVPFNFSASVTEVGANYVKINQAAPTVTCSGTLNYFNLIGTISKNSEKKGGDLRVASIKTKELGGQEYKVRYLYASGGLSIEPTYLKSINYNSFPYNLPDFPNTPVIYGSVSVLNGKLATDSDFESRQVYEFEKPNSTLITYTKTLIGLEKELIYERTASLFNFKEYQTKAIHELNYYTSRIGRVNGIKMYDKVGTLKSSSTFYYNNILPNNRGLYSEGSILADRFFIAHNNGSGFLVFTTLNLIGRTIKKTYPNVLYKVINSKDGFTDSSEDLAWDFISGSVTEKITQSSLGLKIKTVLKPAYLVYPELGPKASVANPTSNKNMINAVAAQYVYKLDNANAIVGLISGSASTMKKDWNNYRYLSGASYTQGTQGPDVWRKQKDFFYGGTYASLRSDGSLTFIPANEFSFVGGANAGWQLAQEVNRYDHFSVPVETKDLYGRYSSVKTDLDGKQVLAQAQNATYFEFAYSGAEDIDNTKLFFGGEIERKDGTIITKSVPDDVHTGNAAVTVNTNGKTFVYKTGAANPITANRFYRASVWTKSLNGAIYYNLNGAGEQTTLPLSTQKVGNWYQINVEINVGAFTSLEVGVKSTNGTVAFDDFRFQPIDGAVSANVYNAITGDLEYVLDNNNLYTRYEYNDRGLLTKTYRESIKYQSVKLLSESKDNFKRFNINQ